MKKTKLLIYDTETEKKIKKKIGKDRGLNKFILEAINEKLER